jgi:hypothetical protein
MAVGSEHEKLINQSDLCTASPMCVSVFLNQTHCCSRGTGCQIISDAQVRPSLPTAMPRAPYLVEMCPRTSHRRRHATRDSTCVPAHLHQKCNPIVNFIPYKLLYLVIPSNPRSYAWHPCTGWGILGSRRTVDPTSRAGAFMYHAAVHARAPAPRRPTGGTALSATVVGDSHTGALQLPLASLTLHHSPPSRSFRFVFFCFFLSLFFFASSPEASTVLVICNRAYCKILYNKGCNNNYFNHGYIMLTTN